MPYSRKEVQSAVNDFSRLCKPADVLLLAPTQYWAKKYRDMAYEAAGYLSQHDAASTEFIGSARGVLARLDTNVHVPEAEIDRYLAVAIETYRDNLPVSD